MKSNFNKWRAVMLMLFICLFVGPSYFTQATSYYKIRFTLDYRSLEDRMDGLFKMEIGFSFYIQGYQGNSQLNAFTKEHISKGWETHTDLVYTTPFGYAVYSLVRWYYYENDVDDLNVYDDPGDELIVYCGAEQAFVFYVGTSRYTFDRNNDDDHGDIDFFVDFIYTTREPPI